jgi:hypothetical protein
MCKQSIIMPSVHNLEFVQWLVVCLHIRNISSSWDGVSPSPFEVLRVFLGLAVFGVFSLKCGGLVVFG